MPKTVVFELNATLKAGSLVCVKGTRFTEETLPEAFRVEVEKETGTISVHSYGTDLEGSSFDPEQTITIKKPRKVSKLIKPKK